MKRFYPNGPTAAELEDLRVFANRTDAVGLFIGPHRYYTFNDLPSELTKPVKEDGGDAVALGLSPAPNRKSSNDGTNGEGASWVHGVRLENSGTPAQDKDAIKPNEASGAKRVRGSDAPNIDDDDAENADGTSQANLANQPRPGGQAGSVVDVKNDSSYSTDSDTNLQLDTAVSSTVEDDFGLERFNSKALSGKEGLEVPLYSEIELKALDDEMRSKIGGKDADDKLGKRIMALALRGNKRRLMALPADWSERLDRLAERFLNFKTVIDYVRTECHVASISTTRAAKLAPILLLGSPGIGKTAFAMDLAEILSGSFYMVAMENSQSGSSIGGSAKFWSNTRTGMVFDALVDKDVINPVFLVDEIDKAATASAYDPMAPLYQLLEARTAAIFRDESIPELAIDTSHINWILTANDIDRVPAPILSRLHIVEVPNPTPGQTRLIIEHIFTETVGQLKATVVKPDYVAVLDQMTMAKGVVDALCIGGIRVVKRLIRNATVKALGRQSTVVEFPDIYDLASFGIDPVYMLPQ